MTSNTTSKLPLPNKALEATPESLAASPCSGSGALQIHRYRERKMARARSKRKLSPSARMEDARRWLKKGLPVHPLTDGYMRRYGIERWVAQEELIDIGYREEVQIEAYEKEGVEWEFMYDPCSGEMKPVPIGTKKHELHLF